MRGLKQKLGTKLIVQETGGAEFPNAVYGLGEMHVYDNKVTVAFYAHKNSDVADAKGKPALKFNFGNFDESTPEWANIATALNMLKRRVYEYVSANKPLNEIVDFNNLEDRE